MASRKIAAQMDNESGISFKKYDFLDKSENDIVVKNCTTTTTSEIDSDDEYILYAVDSTKHQETRRRKKFKVLP